MTGRDEIIARLTGPGARFERGTEIVAGHPMEVYLHRHRSLVELLEASRGFGEQEYLVAGSSRLTFSEHYTQVAALAAALREEFGVGPGDRVGLCAANRAEWIVCFWATVSLGAIAVGMNSMWAPPEIAHGVRLTTPKVVFVDPARRGAVEAALADSGIGCAVVILDALAGERVTPDAARGADWYGELLLRHRGASLRPAKIDEDDPAAILFTSGTTGRPKGATHSHRNMIAAVWFHLLNDAVATALGGFPSNRRFLLATPLFHIAALHNLAVVRLAVGDTAVLHLGRFAISEVLALIEAERVTNWGAVPTMISRLLDADTSRYDLSSLRTVSVSSAPSTAQLKQRLRQTLPGAAASLSTNYGLTESSTAATLATPAELLADPETVGRPVPTMQVEIRDPGGKPVPDGVVGDIHVRGPQVMLGYFNDPAATATAFTADGWFRTGDLGRMRDGALSIVSRRSDLILRGAENVYPAEIEDQLGDHPAVSECVVLGLPDEDYGQAVAAVVVQRPGSTVTEHELREFLLARLARYKVPTSWLLTTQPLPRNATGKVVRHRVVWR